MDTSEIITRIAHLLDTKQANTFFINGAPGTGKSFLLEKLADDLVKELPKTRVLGPYKETTTNPISYQLLKNLFDQGYLLEMPDQSITDDLNSTWFWLKNNIKISLKQSFVILVDIDQILWNDYDSLRIIFSSLRYLEHFWDSRQVQLIFVLVGFWDHPGLEEYYGMIQLSFPYTGSYNYLRWEEISFNDFVNYSHDLDNSFFQKNGYINVLHEIAGGNPTVMKEITRNIDPKIITINNLIKATYITATKGQVCEKFLGYWKELPDDSIKTLNKILTLRQIPNYTLHSSTERLLLMGIIKEKQSQDIRCIMLRSWFVELMLRHFAKDLRLSNSISQNSDVSDLMPTITILNQKAFYLLQEIEILLRNFIVTQLWKYRSDGEPLLSGWFFQDYAIRQNGDLKKRIEKDAQEVADDWRERSRQNGLSDNLNPDIAYLSLPDLAGILSDLSRKKGSRNWDKVTNAIKEVVCIRDAVMHNQLIEIDDFEKILILQNKISAAISDEDNTIT